MTDISHNLRAAILRKAFEAAYYDAPYRASSPALAEAANVELGTVLTIEQVEAIGDMSGLRKSAEAAANAAIDAMIEISDGILSELQEGHWWLPIADAPRDGKKILIL